MSNVQEANDTVLGTATYSPEDNKLRMYPYARLSAEDYARAKAAGFSWAPKQKLFVAPMWTPERADVLMEWCGEIGDEDTSLVDRAEERSERFEEYSDKREADANQARQAVAQIADNIPLGQPILIGHHSEKHARRDAKRIENGMRKAVKMWETSKYWEQRAEGAIRHARYKELPAVRHRRIKGLEADKRKHEKEIKISELFSKLWSREELTREQALAIAGRDRGSWLWSDLDKNTITVEDAKKRALASHAASLTHHRRWLAHIENRLAYERAMLGESGGVAASKFNIEIGGRVLCSGWMRSRGYLVVGRINKTGGVINSVSTTEGVVPIERVEDYRAPEADDAEKVKAAKKLPPLVNYPGEGFRHLTKAEYDSRAKHSGFWHIKRMKATDKYGAHRQRHATAKDGGYNLVGAYLTDVKRVDPPPPEGAPLQIEFEHQPAPLSERPAVPKREPTVFDQMKQQLKTGIAVVSAPQLFPTPPELARRMVALANIEPGMCVLEPSAGTGNIARAVLDAVDTEVLAYEINQGLCSQLERAFPSFKLKVVCRDFLTVEDFVGCYPRILMNPPFVDGQDIDHVLHAWKMLAPGGVLVSVMGAGINFRSEKKYVALRQLIEEHGEKEDLPDGTFSESGTNVRTVLVTLRKE
jgi:predicted RNA methylase